MSFELCECVKIHNAYHFVIQTTIGRKNLDDIKDETEILRFALDDKDGGMIACKIN